MTANKARKGNRMQAKQAITLFENHDFGSIRAVKLNGEPWFVGRDVAEILGYRNGSRDINRHVDAEDRQNYQNGTFASPRGMTVVNESGLYSLIFASKLPAAKQFKRWVTAEVLPSIRKTGSYSLKPETVALIGERTDAELTKALVQYDNRVKGRAKQKATIARKKAAAYWTDAQILVAISRVISAKLCGRDFARGTNTMYDVIENECGVPLHKRQEYWERGLGTSITAYTRRLYTFIVPEEMPAVLAGLSAWCAERGLDISEIVSKRQGRLVA